MYIQGTRIFKWLLHFLGTEARRANRFFPAAEESYMCASIIMYAHECAYAKMYSSYTVEKSSASQRASFLRWAAGQGSPKPDTISHRLYARLSRACIQMYIYMYGMLHVARVFLPLSVSSSVTIYYVFFSALLSCLLCTDCILYSLFCLVCNDMWLLFFFVKFCFSVCRFTYYLGRRIIIYSKTHLARVPNLNHLQLTCVPISVARQKYIIRPRFILKLSY